MSAISRVVNRIQVTRTRNIISVQPHDVRIREVSSSRPVAKATGGVISFFVDALSGNTWAVHTCRGSASIVPTADLIGVRRLVVAGGGGAGSGGGGGGGGVIADTCDLLNGISYPAVVGAGGIFATTGGDSSFRGVTAYGGGWGAGINAGAGGSGGSGGGGGETSTGISVGGVGVSGQGHNGGTTSYLSNPYPGSGGGGAGGVGGNADTSAPGQGGPGVTSDIQGFDAVFGAGGGAASNLNAGVNSLGGSNDVGGHGGGGTGRHGTGSGGGGHGSGYGGDGVVIVAYIISS